jgi:hypothetical protein
MVSARKKQRQMAGVFVDRPRDVLDRCKNILAKSLSNPDSLSFEERGHVGGEREFLLRGVPYTTARARNHYPVALLLRTKDKTFWIAASFRFTPELRQLRLTSVSLLIFEGLATDSDKMPLLRAEWDDWDSEHAQPHWHVYSQQMQPHPLIIESELFRENAPPQKFQPETYKDATLKSSLAIAAPLYIERFHYAMASSWHLKDASTHRCELSRDALLSWLTGCISYTRNQLQYIFG